MSFNPSPSTLINEEAGAERLLKPGIIRGGTQWVAVVIEGSLVVGFDRGKGGVHCVPHESW
ncbi:hypothetical protein ACU8KG_04100 [Rhizobium leguminosarum]